MRVRFILASLAIAGIAVVAFLLLKPTFNAPVTAQVAGFGQEASLLKRLTVADGYALNLFATSVGKARVMRQLPSGNFVVTAARDGSVYLVRSDSDGDGRSDGVERIAKGLRRPHGLMIEGEAVYVAESHRVSVFELIGEDRPGKAALKFRRTAIADIPADGGHSTRTIGRGPDGALYVSVGSSCNVCIEEHPWRAAMIRLAPGGTPELFAEGLRNSVGFDWRSGTDELYAVNAGRDLLGDDFPREEMNLVVKGAHYGWPYVNENNVPDPDLGDEKPAGLQPLPPAHMFTAHSTPLSIRFLRHQAGVAPGTMALVPRHGSWNRSTKSGYDVLSLHWQAGGSITQRPFITGFEIDEHVIGRPVGAFETKDGTIYITDDFAQAVYRVVRQP